MMLAMKNIGMIAALFMVMLVTVFVHAQQAEILPNIPAPTIEKKTYPPFGYYANIFSGGGQSIASGRTNSAEYGIQLGGMTNTYNNKVPCVTWIELGGMGPFADRDAQAAFAGFSYGPILKYGKHYVLASPVGYDYIFSESHSLDYGLQYVFSVHKVGAYSIEGRDNYIFTTTHQHQVVIRLGVIFNLPDE